MISRSLVDTKKIAENFLCSLDSKRNGAVVVALAGDLGSGKTAFVQAVGKLLGINEVITSPTFVIMKKYPLSYEVIKSIKLSSKKEKTDSGILSTYNFRFSTPIHIDAYRLQSGQELERLNFSSLLEDNKNLIFIEWPEWVADILPDNTMRINFKFLSETEREIIG